MGGKMNLNPLKKDDNTDSLVQALQDANNVGTTAVDQGVPTSQPPVTTDPSSLGGFANTSSQPQSDEQTSDAGILNNEPKLVIDDPGETTDSTTPDASNITTEAGLSGSELPESFTSDANAHITPPASTDGDLETVKKSALEQLRPLIETLELEPNDKFDKYLMMLRASDDPTLIKPAFEAAQSIATEKERAQALLDVINEINYITANQTANDTQPAE